MLSEEENKAINNMKLFARVHQDMTVVTAKEMDIILNLIEKQEKIIKEQSYTNKKIRRTLKTVRKERNRQNKIIDKMADELFIEYTPHFNTQEECKEYFTKLVKEEI